jgi:hypothetical protein
VSAARRRVQDKASRAGVANWEVEEAAQSAAALAGQLYEEQQEQLLRSTTRGASHCVTLRQISDFDVAAPLVAPTHIFKGDRNACIRGNIKSENVDWGWAAGAPTC